MAERLFMRPGSLPSCLMLALAIAPTALQARIVSVPDLHGDYERAVKVLAAAKLIDPATLAWVGGDATLIQTGDIVDRGDDGLKIYNLFRSLAKQAHKAGGEVINLLGNHELMNIQADLRYVSEGDARTYGGWEKREEMWSPGGDLGSWIRSRPVVAKVGRVLFVHAGLHPSFLDGGKTLDDINKEFAKAVATDGNPRGGRRAKLLGDSGPVWSRFFPDGTPKVCAAVADVLKRTETVRMVVGHTIQVSDDGETFRVNPLCDGSLVMGDTAISRAYGGAMSFIEYDGEGGAVVKYPTQYGGRAMEAVVLPGGIKDKPASVTEAAKSSSGERVPSEKVRKSPVLTPEMLPGGAAKTTSLMFKACVFLVLMIPVAAAVLWARGQKPK